jgi:hypothetical protein
VGRGGAQDGAAAFRYDGECRDGQRHGRGLCRWGAVGLQEAYFDGYWVVGVQVPLLPQTSLK